MGSYKFRILAAILLLLALVLIWVSLSSQPTRRAFIGGQILSMDARNTIHEAILVDDGKILAIGSNQDIEGLVDKRTEVTNLMGKTLMPGIVDAHSHFPASGLFEQHANLNSPPIGDVTNMAQLLAAMQASADDTAPGKWLLGFGYDDSLIAEKRHPTLDELDEVSSEHPIFLLHISGHMVVANSMALEAVGIDINTPDPEGGVIGRTESGELNGLLMEAASDEIKKQALDFGTFSFLKMLRHANQEYLSMGVTTAQAGAAEGKAIEGLRWASRLGLVKTRLVMLPLAHEVGRQWRDGEIDLTLYNRPEFNIGPVKIFVDGSIQGFTGYLREPYHTPYHGDREYRGFPVVSQASLNEEVQKFHRAGIQMAIHGNGDAAIDQIIDAFALAQESYNNPDPRLVVIHAQMARRDQLEKFARLGMVPSFFSAHTYYWGDRHRDIFLGPERAAIISPARWAQQNQLRFTIHLDTPVVPMQPFLLLWSAINRQTSGGQTLGEGQKISTMQALRAITIDAAWQIFQDSNRGSLEVGKWADMIILSDDPLLNPAAVRHISVLETLVAGRTVYRKR